MRAARLRLFVAGLWAIGYLVAPALFLGMRDKAQAGAIVGFLLRGEAWLSMACALVLMILLQMSAPDRPRTRTLSMLVGGMLACALIIYLGVQPLMAHLREAAALQGVPQGRRFGILHAASQLVYLVESVLAGGGLLVKIR